MFSCSENQLYSIKLSLA